MSCAGGAATVSPRATRRPAPPSLPLVIGHRGAAARAPENTLAGIQKAAAGGAGWVELDARLTRDGVPVLLHDSGLERTTNGRGRLTRWDDAALRRLDAGVWFGPAFRGQRVPRLREAAALVAALGLGMNVEIKPVRGHGAATAAAVITALRTSWPGSVAPPLLSSFDRAALETAAALAPAWPRGLLLRRPRGAWREAVDGLALATLHCAAGALTARTVAILKSPGLPLAAFTVDQPARARELFGWGVDAVFSDDPGGMLAALGR